MIVQVLVAQYLSNKIIRPYHRMNAKTLIKSKQFKWFFLYNQINFHSKNARYFLDRHKNQKQLLIRHKRLRLMRNKSIKSIKLHWTDAGIERWNRK